FGPDVVDFTNDRKQVTNTGQFVAAISISAFIDPEVFGNKVDAAFDAMRAAKPLPCHDKVRVPGENREATRRERLAHGIPVHPKLHRDVSALAEEREIAGTNEPVL